MYLNLNGEVFNVRKEVYSRYESFDENGGLFLVPLGRGKYQLVDMDFVEERDICLEIYAMEFSIEDDIFHELVQMGLSKYGVDACSSLGEIITGASVGSGIRSKYPDDYVIVEDPYNLTEDEVKYITKALEEYQII